MRADRHLASVPIIILLTHSDHLHESQRAAFKEVIGQTFNRKLTEIASGEEKGLEDEMRHIDDSDHGRNHVNRTWKDSQVILCSAKSG